MRGLEDFAAIMQANQPLGPFTCFKVGGPAEALVQPRLREELAAVVRRCAEKGIPLRVLGGGCNVLVRDEGVRGVVLRLSEPAFANITVDGTRVCSGAGAALSALISEATRHGLAGFESLVGIPGTVGGALICNAGDRSGEIGQYVHSVEVLNDRGEIETRGRDELSFADNSSNLDDPVLLAAEFELDTDSADALVKRMRKAWIHRKAGQPLSFEAAVRVFKNPRGFSAAALIDQAGLAKTRVGKAEVSDRNASYLVAQPGACARDILRLIDLIRSQVRERFGTELELAISVW